MVSTEIFYHGSCYLFDKFSSAFIGLGEGKSKFGYGIYITSSYKTAALYASKAAKANGKESCYVYTVEVPLLTDDNHIFSCKPINADVVSRVEKEIGEVIPDEVKTAGKLFRKYLVFYRLSPHSQGYLRYKQYQLLRECAYRQRLPNAVRYQC